VKGYIAGESDSYGRDSSRPYELSSAIFRSFHPEGWRTLHAEERLDFGERQLLKHLLRQVIRATDACTLPRAMTADNFLRNDLWFSCRLMQRERSQNHNRSMLYSPYARLSSTGLGYAYRKAAKS
jgi:hypothetical protein